MECDSQDLEFTKTIGSRILASGAFATPCPLRFYDPVVRAKRSVTLVRCHGAMILSTLHLELNRYLLAFSLQQEVERMVARWSNVYPAIKLRDYLDGEHGFRDDTTHSPLGKVGRSRERLQDHLRRSAEFLFERVQDLRLS